MKAASLLRHIWVGFFMCALFLGATGVAYAKAASGGVGGKTTATTNQEEVVQKGESNQKGSEIAVTADKGATLIKNESKPATSVKRTEVKKESNTSFFSFSFLYYLFYKSNFAETTNSAVKNTWSTLLSRLFD